MPDTGLSHPRTGTGTGVDWTSAGLILGAGMGVETCWRPVTPSEELVRVLRLTGPRLEVGTGAFDG